MKKFFLISLMTLVCSVMAWATDVTLGTGGDYQDLGEAITAVGDAGTITLTSDVTCTPQSPVTIPNNKDVTIEFAGHKLTLTQQVLAVNVNAKLSLTSTQPGAVFHAAAAEEYAVAVIEGEFRLGANVELKVKEGITPAKGYVKSMKSNGSSNTKITIENGAICPVVYVDNVTKIVVDNDASATKVWYDNISSSQYEDASSKYEAFADNIIASKELSDYDNFYIHLAKNIPASFYDEKPEKAAALDACIDADHEKFLSVNNEFNNEALAYCIAAKEGGKAVQATMFGETVYFVSLSDACTAANAHANDEVNEVVLTLLKDLVENGDPVGRGGGRFTNINLNGKKLTIATWSMTPLNATTTYTRNLKLSGTGTIEKKAGSNSNYLFGLKGVKNDVTAHCCSLIIGKDVTISVPDNVTAILIDQRSDGKSNGVYVEMNGTITGSVGIQTNGNIKYTKTTGNLIPEIVVNGTINATDVAIYNPAYAKLTINDGASLTGKSAIAIKSGIFNMTGGTLHATLSEEEAGRQDTWGNGVNEAGAALQIESNTSYAGNMELNISGGTLISDGWYAIYEYGTGETAVKSIAVTGGNFQGGILLSQALAAKGGFVSGGKWSKDVSANIKAGENLSLLNNEDADASIYPYLVGVPTPAQEADYAEKDANNNAVLTNAASQSAAESYSSDNVGNYPDVIATKETNPVVVSENTDVVATEAAPIVEVKKVTVDNDAQLTVTEGATLMVGAGAVQLSQDAQLTVEPGAALVVNGLVYGSTEDNFVIENEENNPGVVLFSPETEFIKEDHPKATYKFKSRSYKDGSKVVYQRFGIPTHDNNVRMAYETTPAEGAYSYIVNWDYEQDGWHTSGDVVDWRLIDRENGLTVGVGAPFTCFELISNNAKGAEYTYTFTGDLMGNADADMSFAPGFNPYANSYTAPIDIQTFLSRIDAQFKAQGITPSIYLYHSPSNDNYQWVSVSLADFEFDEAEVTTIAPMQAFLMELGSGAAVNAQNLINYDANVYSPFMSNLNGGASLAPARKARNNNYIKLTIANEEGAVLDRVKMIEDNRFDGEYEMGYDVHKYMNDEVNMYAVANNENMASVADSDVDNLNICVNVHEAGTYTLNVAHCGLDYVLYDLVNDAVITLTDGQAYNFYQEAGQTSPRFQLAKANKMPTNIENAEGENAQTIKVMKNGMLMIIKNGVKYNAFGQTIK